MSRTILQTSFGRHLEWDYSPLWRLQSWPISSCHAVLLLLLVVFGCRSLPCGSIAAAFGGLYTSAFFGYHFLHLHIFRKRDTPRKRKNGRDRDGEKVGEWKGRRLGESKEAREKREQSTARRKKIIHFTFSGRHEENVLLYSHFFALNFLYSKRTIFHLVCSLCLRAAWY